ncbi:MAG: OmpA family protein [Labilithrix sp.]|nr:OmpA family protein [Labilithrix sp.]
MGPPDDQVLKARVFERLDRASVRPARGLHRVPVMEPNRSKRGIVWLVGLVAVVAGVALIVLWMKARRPEGASRETTLTGADVERHAQAPAGAACATHASCAEGSLCARGRCEPITEATPDCGSVEVRFAEGVADLSPSADVEIERAARCLKAHRDPRLAIEPSSDANISAGENDAITLARLSTVHRALQARGVPAERLDAMRPEPLR